MRTDFDLPPPRITYGEAKRRLAVAPIWLLALVRDQRRLLATGTPKRRLSKYYLRQLVEHAELANSLARPAQLTFDFGENA